MTTDMRSIKIQRQSDNLNGRQRTLRKQNFLIYVSWIFISRSLLWHTRMLGGRNNEFIQIIGVNLQAYREEG